jgi:hypothetical protein
MKVLRYLAILMMFAGAGDWIRLRFIDTEKNAYFFLGHWFDAFWEVQLPLLLIGASTIIFVFFRYWSKKS